MIVGVLLVALVIGGLLRLTQDSSGSDSDVPSPQDLPSDVVAAIAEVPASLETVTKPEFDRALLQAAASAEVDPIHRPGDPKYGELKEVALGELLDAIWIQGQAEEMKIAVTPAEISTEREKLTQETFKTDAEYREFLEESHFSEADVDKRVKVQILSTAIQDRLDDGAFAPSEQEIERYYAANKETQFDNPTTGTEPLSTVRSQIRAQLREEIKQEAFADFVKDYEARWRSRTVCAPAFTIERCSNGKQAEPQQDDDTGGGEIPGLE